MTSRLFHRVLALLVWVAVPAKAENVAQIAQNVTPSNAAVESAPSYVYVPPPGYIAVPIDSLRAHKKDVWYGEQTLLTDAAALGLLFLIPATGSEASPLLGFGVIGTYLLGGPIVHAAHDNWGTAAGSLGLRVGAPLVGGGLGMAAFCNGSSDTYCALAGLAVGGLVGIAAAITIDSAVLARETVTVRPTLIPVVQATKSSALVGVAGQF